MSFLENRMDNLIMGMAMYFLFEEDVDEKTRVLRFEAAIKLIPIIRHYAGNGIMDSLITRLCLQKLAYISKAQKKKEIDEILAPPKPRYNGSKVVVVTPYYVAEEEMLIWSETSLRAPLDSAGFDRYMEVFKKVFGFTLDELDKDPALIERFHDAA